MDASSSDSDRGSVKRVPSKDEHASSDEGTTPATGSQVCVECEEPTTNPDSVPHGKKGQRKCKKCYYAYRAVLVR